MLDLCLLEVGTIVTAEIKRDSIRKIYCRDQEPGLRGIKQPSQWEGDSPSLDISIGNNQERESSYLNRKILI